LGVPHGWLVRGANVRGRNRVGSWLRQGYCSIGWDEAGRIDPGGPRDEIRAALAAAYPGRTSRWVASSAGNLDRFLNSIAVGDLVVTVDGPDVYVGRVVSAPTWVPRAPSGEARRRAVQWINPGEPIARDELSAAASARLRTMLTVTSVAPVAPELARLAG
jgi:5-methylcytosine-specific restriction protein B